MEAERGMMEEMRMDLSWSKDYCKVQQKKMS